MASKCQGCGAFYNVDLNVPEEIWEKIKPNWKEPGSGMLCGMCIVTNLERLRAEDPEYGPSLYGAWTLKSNQDSSQDRRRQMEERNPFGAEQKRTDPADPAGCVCLSVCLAVAFAIVVFLLSS